MQIKRFEGTSMEEILSRVRKTLGEDALILSTRKRENGKMGVFTEAVYEVSAAVDRNPAPAPPGAAPARKNDPPAAAAPPPFESFLSLEKELAPLRDEIATMKKYLSLIVEERGRPGTPEKDARLDRLIREVRSLQGILNAVPAGGPANGPAAPKTPSARKPVRPSSPDWLVERLLAQGVEPGACRRILDAAAKRCAGAVRVSPEAIRREAGTLIESIIRVAEVPPPRDYGPRILAFIGPAGSGKTVTVCRVGGLLSRMGFRCAAISAGDDPGAHKALAARLKRPHRIPSIGARNAREISRAVSRCFGADYILIDVSGNRANDRETLKELTASFGGRAEIDFCLTLPASWGGTRADRLVRNLSPLPVHSLTFTKLDETDRYGAMFNAAAWSGRPVLFLTAGRDIPGQIFPARPYMFSRLLLEKNAS